MHKVTKSVKLVKTPRKCVAENAFAREAIGSGVTDRIMRVEHISANN